MNKVISFLDNDQKIKSYFLIILMFFASILEFLGLGTILMVINDFLNIENTSIFKDYFLNFFNKHNQIDYLKILFSFILFVYTFKFILLVVVSWKETKFLTDLRKTISQNLYENFLYRSPSEVLKKNSAEYLRNFTDEITSSLVFFNAVLKIVLDSLLILSLLIFLIYFNAKVTVLVATFFGSISCIYYIALNKRLLRWAKTALENKRKRIKFINESFLAIKYIKIFSAENYFLKKFYVQNRSLSEIMFKQNFASTLPRHLLEYLLLLSIILLLFLFKNVDYENDKIIQILSIFTLVSFRLMPMISRLLVSSQQIRYNYPSIEKLYIESSKKIIKKQKNYKSFDYKKYIKIKFKFFSYSFGKLNTNSFKLKNINLTFNKNLKIGLIGPSGSGKSTIIDMICGFIKLSNNQSPVYVDGININQNLNGWQKIIGYVPQNTVILNDTLKQNILFGSSKDIFDDKKVLEVIKKVQLNHFLKKLPGGLSHLISQDGINISGGEKQRIGIARALLHNPKLLILDEATSGLDSFTETKILKTIKKLNKTVIIVTHRINSLSICDKIYKIEKNTIKNLKIKKTIK